VFRGFALLGEATFFGPAEFLAADFSHGGDFSGAVFCDEARFDNVKFSGDAYFINVEFSGDARFVEATFAGDAMFDGATFSASKSRDARFLDARILHTHDVPPGRRDGTARRQSWPAGWSVRPDADDPRQGTLVRSE